MPCIRLFSKKLYFGRLHGFSKSDFRKIRGAITALKIQVCIALIGAYAAILKSLHESLNKVSNSFLHLRNKIIIMYFKNNHNVCTYLAIFIKLLVHHMEFN